MGQGQWVAMMFRGLRASSLALSVGTILASRHPSTRDILTNNTEGTSLRRKKTSLALANDFTMIWCNSSSNGANKGIG